MNRVYVYALVDRPARAIRVAERRIVFVRAANIAAAVEERNSAPELSETSLREQHDVVSTLAGRFDAILPVRFGALLQLGELERLMRARESILRAALEQVRGREQMTTRIFDGAGGARPAARVRTGSEYLAARAAAVSVPESLTSLRLAVSEVAVAEHVERGRGRAATVLHHLIPRGHADRFRAAVLQTIGDRTGMETIEVTGPFAPFAFTPDIW